MKNLFEGIDIPDEQKIKLLESILAEITSAHHGPRATAPVIPQAVRTPQDEEYLQPRTMVFDMPAELLIKAGEGLTPEMLRESGLMPPLTQQQPVLMPKLESEEPQVAEEAQVTEKPQMAEEAQVTEEPIAVEEPHFEEPAEIVAEPALESQILEEPEPVIEVEPPPEPFAPVATPAPAVAPSIAAFEQEAGIAEVAAQVPSVTFLESAPAHPTEEVLIVEQKHPSEPSVASGLIKEELSDEEAFRRFAEAEKQTGMPAEPEKVEEAVSAAVGLEAFESASLEAQHAVEAPSSSEGDVGSFFAQIEAETAQAVAPQVQEPEEKIETVEEFFASAFEEEKPKEPSLSDFFSEVF